SSHEMKVKRRDSDLQVLEASDAGVEKGGDEVEEAEKEYLLFPAP
ncbi:hypothetical protein A2U01_0044403, partial [Trifolium medium]|nr:hypothetical protein [Trifolium medium]